MTNNSQKYELKILSQTENLEIVRDFVATIASKSGFGIDDVNKIELAVDEACANVIKHAYQNQNSQNKIHLIVQLEFDKITVIIADEGKGFDIHKIKDLNLDEYIAEMRVGGLGIHLMKNLMDEVKFERIASKRNEVRMIKYYSTPNGALVNTNEQTSN